MVRERQLSYCIYFHQKLNSKGGFVTDLFLMAGMAFGKRRPMHICNCPTGCRWALSCVAVEMESPIFEDVDGQAVKIHDAVLMAQLNRTLG